MLDGRLRVARRFASLTPVDLDFLLDDVWFALPIPDDVD
jgi:hypothetical protein